MDRIVAEHRAAVRRSACARSSCTRDRPRQCGRQCPASGNCEPSPSLSNTACGTLPGGLMQSNATPFGLGQVGAHRGQALPVLGRIAIRAAQQIRGRALECWSLEEALAGLARQRGAAFSGGQLWRNGDRQDDTERAVGAADLLERQGGIARCCRGRRTCDGSDLDPCTRSGTAPCSSRSLSLELRREAETGTSARGNADIGQLEDLRSVEPGVVLAGRETGDHLSSGRLLLQNGLPASAR